MADFATADRSHWQWTALIGQPAPVSEDLLARIIAEAGQKKSLPALLLMRMAELREGTCGQIMHTGPYATEGPTIARLHAFLHEQGFTFDGRDQKHHEIYLGDPRRSAPDKLRTLIRQPVTRP